MQKNKLLLDKVELLLLKDLLKKDFEFINVSPRGTIAQLNPKCYDGFLCFPLLPFSIQQQNCPFYSNNVWNDQFPFKNSTIFILGKYIASNYKNYPLFLKYAFIGFLHKKHLQEEIIYL